MGSLRFCSRRLHLIVLGMMVCIPGLVGCGGAKKSTVSGKVTYKGEALGNGAVVFIGENNTGGSSTISADGTYKIANLPPGPVKITVETNPLPQSMSQVPNMPEMPGMEGKTPAARYVEIPPRYKSPEQSGLTYTVTPGVQTHDILLD